MIAYRREYAGGWRHPFIDASIATDLDRLMEDRFIIGGPEQCVADDPPLRGRVRNDSPHLPDLLPGHAAPAYHARARADRAGGGARFLVRHVCSKYVIY